MAKKKTIKKATKRAEGRKLHNFAFDEKDTAKWREVAEKENRSLTKLIETVMNNYVKNVK